MEIIRLIFSPIEVNTYILADKSGDCAIIDCGCYDSQETEELEKLIEERKLHPALLLDTHCHLDHIFGNRFLLERYNLGAYSSELDEYNRTHAPQHAQLFGLTMDTPPAPGGYLTDNQIFSFGNTRLKALHVPGHAPGGFAFYSEENGCVFTGDALFAGSIGRTDLHGGNYDLMINSIRNRLFVLPETTMVYPGHGKETTIGDEIRTNPFFS